MNKQIIFNNYKQKNGSQDSIKQKSQPFQNLLRLHRKSFFIKFLTRSLNLQPIFRLFFQIDLIILFIRAQIVLILNIYTKQSPPCSKNQSNKKVSFWKKEIEKGPQVYPPNNTVYIHNLNEKVPIDELKDTLLNTFQEYGEIIDIIAKKNIRMRGQAFIIYKDINSAMEAKRKLNGKQLYGKTLKVQFAREKSDVIAKIDGTFQIREKPQSYFQMKFEQKFIQRPQQLKAKVQREKNVLKKADNSNNPPNHILFCQGLNAEITTQMLTQVFIRYPGLTDVRLAPKNFAFIQYEDQFKAGTALAALSDTKIGQVTMKLSYAKK